MDHPFAHHDEDADMVVPSGFLDACILLALEEHSAYGYQLKSQLDDLGLHGLDRGRIYRALRSLEAAGLVSSQWHTTNRGPARRTYELTPAGRLALRARVLKVRRQRRQLSRFLNRFERVTRPEAVA